jgi:hypothetical protein
MRVEFRELDKFGSFQEGDAGDPISRSKLLHTGLICLVSKSNLSLISVADGHVVLKYDIRGRDAHTIESWKSLSFFSGLDR